MGILFSTSKEEYQQYKASPDSQRPLISPCVCLPSWSYSSGRPARVVHIHSTSPSVEGYMNENSEGGGVEEENEGGREGGLENRETRPSKTKGNQKKISVR